MSTTRTCDKCKWVFPAIYKPNTCQFCKGGIYPRPCSKCRTPIYKDVRCRECNNERMRDWARRNNDKTRQYARNQRIRKQQPYVESYDNWLERINVPAPQLKEPEWLRACSFFNGCALCAEEAIESRTFFIPYTVGGKYTAWNIFPTCGPCGEAVRERKDDNIFLWLYKKKYKPAYVHRLTEYLSQALDRSNEQP